MPNCMDLRNHSELTNMQTTDDLCYIIFIEQK